MWLTNTLITTIFNTLSYFPILHHRTPPDNDPDLHRVSCRPSPPLPTTDRTEFGTRGCTVYAYPSTGGVLIKEDASLLDMLFLQLPRSQISLRASSPDEEDKFCDLMRRAGATWWPCKEARIEVMMHQRGITEEQERVMVYGWPEDGVGVWVLRFKSERDLPRDFGRIWFAMDMGEKILIMREFGAVFVEDVGMVEELGPMYGTPGGGEGEGSLDYMDEDDEDEGKY